MAASRTAASMCWYASGSTRTPDGERRMAERARLSRISVVLGKAPLDSKICPSAE